VLYLLGIRVVFTHLFYVPIALAGAWFGLRWSLGTAFFLGISLVIPEIVMGSCFIKENLLRFSMFIVIACVIGGLKEKKNKSDRVIKYQSYYDYLTRLPNRRMFKKSLNHFLAHVNTNKKLLAVLSLGLDGFKTVNDTLGDLIGDKLLISVSSRLKENLNNYFTIARSGNDEFLILISQVTKGEDLIDIVQKIIAKFKSPFEIDGHELYVTISIGISIYPYDGEDYETLLKSADIAMTNAKKISKNSYIFFSTEMNKNVSDNLKIVNSLRQAIEQDNYENFDVYYQPQVDIKSKKIIGIEALLRWQHPELGWITPDKFIPIAEETGLIVPIGEWVLRTACTQTKAWQSAGFPALRVSVNISEKQLKGKEFINNVLNVLKNTGLDPHYLVLEITETIFMSNPEIVTYALNKLKAIGVGLALDDFGTGYSSLNYVGKLPIDILKLDRVFIGNIINNFKNQAIAKAIISMAHSLNLKVIAEGVETIEQCEYVESQNCDEIQGYLFFKPLTKEEFEKVLYN